MVGAMARPSNELESDLRLVSLYYQCRCLKGRNNLELDRERA